MKKILLFMLLSITFTAYCQTKDTDPTILEKLFSQELDIKGKITQEKEGSRRELIQVGADKQNGFKKYVLTEHNVKDDTTSKTYLVSKKGIEPDYDLYNIKISGENVINFDKINDNPEAGIDKNKPQGKITVKLDDKEYDMNQPFSKLPINSELTTEVCVDHWWVVWVVETG